LRKKLRDQGEIQTGAQGTLFDPFAISKMSQKVYRERLFEFSLSTG